MRLIYFHYYQPDEAPIQTTTPDPHSTDIFRARSHFWNEWVPNADLFLTPSAPGLANDPSLGWQAEPPSDHGHASGDDGPSLEPGLFSRSSASMRTSQHASTVSALNFGHGHMEGMESLEGELGSLDPSDMLVAYMLESTQPN
jgi:hypothetical protein